ncbi:MAG TPA: sulfite oxidase [Egibacteraceae bacterium]|nr:sulfite oxidase [Egibacteraceae bacterium]
MAPERLVETRPPGDAAPPGRGRAGASGALAAWVALATSELLAGLFPSVPSLVVAVGSGVIDRVPPLVKDLAIAVFGTFDKAALVAGMLLVAAVCGAALGVIAVRSLAGAAAGFAVFALVGVAAAVGERQASIPLVAATAVIAAAAGVVALRGLLVRGGPEPGPATGTASGDEAADAEPMTPRGGRRDFLRLAAGLALGAGAAAAGGRILTQRSAAAVARARVRLPAASARLPPPPAAASLPVDGISPLVTPIERFYRIDTALSVPRVDPAQWDLSVTGMVERPLRLSYDELLAMPHAEADVTLVCVSNEVGGDLVGNARWTGVPLRAVLERAGVQPGATQVVGRSVDGWTAGFPTEVAFDGRDALIAVGMNGEPLPIRHGFPARLVVPGLYGYVSATKWLSAIELTTWGAFDGYWVPRGWAKEGPIKTQSRIDVPRRASTVPAGRVAVAGVAWGGIRGIDRVEVSVDGGSWQRARLAEPLGAATWRQWVWDWDAERGRHELAVRATDGEGAVQTAERRRPAPDGATGHHAVTVEVV